MIFPKVSAISDKFKHVCSRYNIMTVFKTKHTLRGVTYENVT